MYIILFLAIAVIILLMLIALAGRIAAPFYLEGHMVRLLIANNGSLPVSYFRSRSKECRNFDNLVSRLTERNNIEIVNDTVLLKKENISKGIKNRFMMWGTRNIEF